MQQLEPRPPSLLNQVQNFICSETMATALQCTAETVGVVASHYIPITALAGACVGGFVFPCTYKVLSKSFPNTFSSRTWTQLSVGEAFSIGTIAGAWIAAPALDAARYTIAAFGLIFSLGTCYGPWWNSCASQGG